MDVICSRQQHKLGIISEQKVLHNICSIEKVCVVITDIKPTFSRISAVKLIYDLHAENW